MAPDVLPDVLPDIAPDVLPDVAPDVLPDVLPDVAADVLPDVVPEFPPDGSPTEGETLTADSSGVSDEDGMNTTDATYQWYSGGAPITGATSSTYTLRNSDTGQLIQVSMTYDDTAGRSTTVLSANTTTVGGTDTNDPVSSEIPNQVVLEDATTTIDVSGYFSDADPDAVLSYAITGASFATINSTGVISASPVQADVTHISTGAIQLTEQSVQAATVTSTNETGVTTTLCTLSVLGGVAASDTCTATVPTGSTGEVVWTTTTSTASMVILDSTSTEVYNSAAAGSFALAAGAYDLTMTESSPSTDTFASNQATVTVTDQDGTATSQTFYMNVTNVNDAFSLGDKTLIVKGDVYDGSSLEAGYADNVVTTTCDSGGPITISATYSCTITVPAGASMTFSLSTYYSYLYASGTLTTPTGTTVSFPSYTFGVSGTYGPYTDAGDYVFALGGDGGYPTATVSAEITQSSILALASDSPLITDGDGVGTIAYQWYADGTAIAGATSATYTPEANNLSLIGTTYSVELSQTDSMGTAETMMSSSSAALALNPAGDLDGDTITNDVDTDVDGDGYHATDQGDGLVDAFVLDAHAWADNDNDGAADSLAPSLGAVTVSPYGTANDTDDDNDGTPDATDAFPFDATEDTDADGDGIGANTDDLENDACYSVDTDGDGFPDAGTGVAGCNPTLVEDSDDDADGIANADDCNVSNATQMYDTDGDGICNSVDTDDDGDGVADWYDDYPLDGDAQYNADGDAFNNTADADDDNDGITDDLDADDDGDGYNDTIDWAPGDPDEWVDSDGDGLGDNYDTDDDDDGVLDGADGCPTDPGASLDSDGDGLCDATLDNDDDNDGVLDVNDAFSLDPDASADFDMDGKADTLNPNLPTEDDYTSVELGTMGLASGSQAVFQYTVPSDVYEVTISFTYGSYAYETTVGIQAPGDTQATAIASGSTGTTITSTYTQPGVYIVIILDSWGDGCNGCTGTASYTYVSGSQEAQSTPYGTMLDNDDDNDGTDDDVDAFPLYACAATDTDGDGSPDELTATCASVGTWTNANPGTAETTIAASGYDWTLDECGMASSVNTPITVNGVSLLSITAIYGPCTYTSDIFTGTVNVTTVTTHNLDITFASNAATFTMDGGSSFYFTSDATVTGQDADGSVIGTVANPLVADDDDDDDGVLDASDAFDTDPTESVDTDGDGTGDNADTDDDEDTVLDANEATGCTLLQDCDSDTYNDSVDTFPLDPTEWADFDGDGIGDNADIDDDGDGVSDAYDWAPFNASEWRDFDGDNNGDANDTDDDNDGVLDINDVFPYDASESSDTDSDGVGDNMDSDDDNDGVDDYDSTGAQLDNCRTIVNSNQANNDGDTSGDLCDDDDDNDGTPDALDDYQMNDAADTDTDGDGMPDDFMVKNTTSVSTCTATNTADTATQYCEGTVASTGQTLTFTLVTAHTWASDLTVIATMPNGDIVTLADRDLSVDTTYTWEFTSLGTYNLSMTDFFSDGGDYVTPPPANGGGGDGGSGESPPATQSTPLSEILSGDLVTPEASSGGLTLDMDDDADGYSDSDEVSACDGEQAYAGYGSTSDPLDSTSTPADMDGDLICDGLDQDRDGDGDFNYDVDGDGSVNYAHGDSEDVFPDDPAEKDDNDNDGTGDNADTDDDNDMWTDVLENTCSGGEADGFSNQYDATSLPDDYDGDMDCDTFDVDDDADGVNDGSDPHPLDECYWSDNDQDGVADYNNEAGCVAHMTSFESGAVGGTYTDTDYNTTHDLVNYPGMSEVNYDTGTVYATASGCPEGGLGSYVTGSGSCTVTVPAGGYATVQAFWPYGFPYVDLNSTSPAGVVTDITSSASSGMTLAEEGTWTFQWTDDPGFPTIAILASEFTPMTGAEAAAQGMTPFEIGYQASWAPSANTGDGSTLTGLADGDSLGATDDVTDVDAFLDGRQGYVMSGTDGTMTLTFDPIDPTGLTAVVSYYLTESTGYNGNDMVSMSFVGATSTVTMMSHTDTAMQAVDGTWTTLTADISNAGIGSLVVMFDTDSSAEALYLDNVYFTTSYQLLDLDDDNDARLDGYDYCPLDPTEQDDYDEDGICDDQDLDDDNDGVFDFNDEFPYDGTESVDDDGDGIGDNADTDDDNDGVDDTEDAFPNDPTETDDYDGDGVGDNADTDDDGDGVSDVDDLWPLNNTLSTDTDGDGIADFFLTPQPYDLMDFETGALPTQGVWTSYSCSIGGGSAPVHPSVSCTNSTTFGPWAVTTDDPINGIYSLDSGENPGFYGVTAISVEFMTLGGTASWNWETSSFFRDFTSIFYDGLEVWADGVKIPASSLGSSCANDVWCGEDSGSMSWDFNGGVHELTFLFRSGTSGTGGSNQAWIDNLQLPLNGQENQLDTDDDNDGLLDDVDLMQFDPCVGLDNDGDGEYDDIVGVNGAGVTLDGSACDTSAYLIDNNDDNDAWTDTDEVSCGTDPMNATDFPTDNDGDLVCDPVDPDDDNDGVDDISDAFPMDPYESSDLDNDGIGDNADPDDDGDGYLDGADAFPTDGSEWTDYDGDGIGDNADTDDDGDGVADEVDAFPLDETEQVDSDGDGFGDNIDPDDDDDGVLDDSDSFPNDSTETVDSDNDGIGDLADDDDDGDGVLDSDDAFPLDPTESEDFDGDGIGDNSDSDIDNDGYSNSADVFDFDASEWGDADGDGIGDNTDSDNDNDGVADELDSFPYDPSETSDLDADGVGDNADADDDGDSYNDDVDAFPVDVNEWLDTDGDGTGDNSDSDDDGDGFSDANEDDCGTDTLDSNDTPPDYDGDGVCDALDTNVDINIDEAEKEEDLGFGSAVPGFPAVLAALALLGAAMVAARRSEE